MSTIGEDTVSLGDGKDIYKLTEAGHALLSAGAFGLIADLNSDDPVFMHTAGESSDNAESDRNLATEWLYIDTVGEGIVGSVLDLNGFLTITSSAFIV